MPTLCRYRSILLFAVTFVIFMTAPLSFYGATFVGLNIEADGWSCPVGPAPQSRNLLQSVAPFRLQSYIDSAYEGADPSVAGTADISTAKISLSTSALTTVICFGLNSVGYAPTAGSAQGNIGESFKFSGGSGNTTISFRVFNSVSADLAPDSELGHTATFQESGFVSLSAYDGSGTRYNNNFNGSTTIVGSVSFTSPTESFDLNMLSALSGRANINTAQSQTQFVFDPLPAGVTCTSSSGQFPGCDGPPVISGNKDRGPCYVGNAPCGDPISIGTGNVSEAITDYTSVGGTPLSFTRFYNSQSPTRVASSFGGNWRGQYDAYLNILTSSSVVAERASGQELGFILSSGVWISDTDVDFKLASNGTSVGSIWTLSGPDDALETYTVISATKAQLTSIKARNGYTRNLTYDSSGQLQAVDDSYSRSLHFTYTNGLLQTVTTPDALVLSYAYGSSGKTPGVNDRLSTVSYNTAPITSQTYLYENASFPFALTGITDEKRNRFSTWTYDGQGRATSNNMGDTLGANNMQVSYDDLTGNRTVTSALGVQETYKFAFLQRISKVTEIDRAASGTVAAAVRHLGYDGNGYLNSSTDWNGNLTSYVNDAHGQPISMIEASGSAVQRTTKMVYDSSFHLPTQIVQDGTTTDLTYDSSGNLLKRTLTDTTTGTSPYATAGQKRTQTFSWGNYGLLASATGPRSDVNATTNYEYDATGAQIKTTNALGQSVRITQHTPGGQPLTLVDANGVTTQLTYDVRQRLTSRTVMAAGGALTTAYVYDAAGNLLSTTLPDGSSLTNAYDAAHRLTKVTDALGNYTSYTLDALGDRTNTNVYKSDGTLTLQRTGTFDPLGHLTAEMAGTDQAIYRAYDPQGNTLTVQDSLVHTTTNIYDALNRLSTSTDANGGVTTSSYDSHDRLVGVMDANGNSTTYARDGFGDVIQQTSPDSGVSVFSYDASANLTSKTDALGIVTNQTFDALDRPLTTTYPADTAENVAYTYDQTSTGFAFGVGRLTGVSDAAGSLTRTYDERGNLTAEKRVSGTKTLTTGYGYDGASRVASITYPDGTQVFYQHDAAGYVSTVNAKPAGSSATTTLATLTHEPFGPLNGAAFGNGVAETWAFDTAYRPTTITDILTATSVQNLIYAYDQASNVTMITDGVNAANSQTFGYDAVNRLASATGGYGGLSWTYDKVGNRLTQVQGATTTAYGYTTGTNRLATITVQTAQAKLQTPRPIKLLKGSHDAVARTALATPGLTPQTKHTLSTGPPRSTQYAGLLGWPLIVLGFAGILGFRRRLLHYRLLAVLFYFSLLTGSAVILNGCIDQLAALTPTFSPGTGSYTGAQTVSISDTTPSATIYYTVDGTTPTNRSAHYSGPISVTSTETVKAIAVANGFSDSTVATATYTITAPPVAATPTFSPAAGSYSSAFAVTIADATPGSTIYYTTNGTTPTTSSTLYTGPLQVRSTETISAVAAVSGYTNSAVAAATYTITALPIVATPALTPSAGAYSATQTVTISDATVGATIYYTLNGSAPTTSSTRYTGPIVVSSTETISAIAVASGYANSAVATATYTVALPPAATPTFSPSAGTFAGAQAITLADATPGATIYYTVDGTNPTPASAVYTAPVTVGASETLKAIATASGYATSAAASAAYIISTAGVTVTTNANGNITSIPPANSAGYATFSYNNANRLASVTGSPTAASFVYDWAGQRFSKTNNGTPPTLYSYSQDGAVISENDNGTITDYVYVDGRPLAILQPGAAPAASQINYVAADRLGTPQAVTNSNGQAVWSAAYQPFGTTSGTETASIAQNLRFPGQLADGETGFSYNLNRDYMPNVGRYLESDPVGGNGGTNTYAYAENNPASNIDFTGEDSLSIITKIVDIGSKIKDLYDEYVFAHNVCDLKTQAQRQKAADERCVEATNLDDPNVMQACGNAQSLYGENNPNTEYATDKMVLHKVIPSAPKSIPIPIPGQ